MLSDISETFKNSCSFSDNNALIDIDDIEINPDSIQGNSQNFKENLTCIICLGLVRKLVSCDECDEIFCNKCIDSHVIRNNNTCPKCNRDLKKRNNRKLNQLMETISISCPSDCGKNIPYTLISDHLSQNCEKIIKNFTCNQCSENIEAFGMNDQRLKNHEELCNNTYLNCVFCNSPIKRIDLAFHMETCSKKTKFCNICSASYPSDTELSHQIFYCEILKSYKNVIESIDKL